MSDDPKAPEEGTSEKSEEFAHSDRTKAEDRPTPVAPSAPADESPADDPPVPDPVEDGQPAPDAAPERPETDVADDAAPDLPDEASTTELATDASSVEPAAPRSPVVPILAVVTGLLFVTTVLFGLMAFAPRLSPIKSGSAKLAVQAMEREDLQTLASRFAKNFVSINYKTIDRDLERMTADTTSAFAEKLERTIEAIGEQFKQRKASSSGEALDAAVISQTDDSALVQVLLRRTKRNVGTKGPETGNQIVNVTLVKTDDGWKVDDLSQLGAEER